MADKSYQNTTGGQVATAHAAGSGGAAAASAGPGRLCRILVMSVGTAVTDFYDNATAASGTKIYTLKASPAIGDIVDVQVPVANGVFVAGATNTSAVVVTTTLDTALGR